jgi:hypothetical protein
MLGYLKSLCNIEFLKIEMKKDRRKWLDFCHLISGPFAPCPFHIICPSRSDSIQRCFKYIFNQGNEK